MANYTVDPITGIKIPTVGEDPGPDYATNISSALETLAHLTHTGASNSDGYKIPTAGLDINDDLSIQSHNLTDVRATILTDQNDVLSGSGDFNCVYSVDGSLYYNDSNGYPIKITAGGTVNTTSDDIFVIKNISANYTIDYLDGYTVFNCNTTSIALLITLPLANDVPAGRFYYFKDSTGHANAHNITIQAAGAQDIDGGSSNYYIMNNFGACMLMSNGSSVWQAYKFDQNEYNTGEQLLIQNKGELSVNGDGYISINDNAHLNVDVNARGVFTAGANYKIELETGGKLNALSGSAVDIKAGSTFDVRNTCIANIMIGDGSQVDVLSDGQLNLQAGSILASSPSANIDLELGANGILTVFNDGYVEVKSGGIVSFDSGSIVTINNGPSYVNGPRPIDSGTMYDWNIETISGNATITSGSYECPNYFYQTLAVTAGDMLIIDVHVICSTTGGTDTAFVKCVVEDPPATPLYEFGESRTQYGLTAIQHRHMHGAYQCTLTGFVKIAIQGKTSADALILYGTAPDVTSIRTQQFRPLTYYP